MAVCHRHIGEISKARICLQLALKLLGSSENEKHSAIILSELKSLDGKVDKNNCKSPGKLFEPFYVIIYILSYSIKGLNVLWKYI